MQQNGGKPAVKELTFDTDEGPRRDTSLEALAKLKPAFHVSGSVTAGTSALASGKYISALPARMSYSRTRMFVSDAMALRTVTR